MRLLLGGEEILTNWQLQEIAPVAVGTLETRKRPTPEVIEWFRSRLPAGTPLALAVAPAASPAGTLQVVARALETALHQLHEAHFDLKTLRSGAGVAPLPPVHPDELQAIGRTNDAILYGAEVTLWVDTTDDAIEAIGPRVTSSASPDHGTRFAELFARYGDFYKIDKQLFAPAVVTFQNLRSGRSFRYGRLAWDMLQQSFGSAG
jgi:methenyltetrahydromethanopterin cyclohydrolase